MFRHFSKKIMLFAACVGISAVFLLTACEDESKEMQLTFPEEIVNVISSDAKTYVSNLASDLYYTEEDNGTVKANDDNTVTFTLTEKQRKNWVENQKEALGYIVSSLEGYDYKVDINDDYTEINLYAPDTFFQNENPDKGVNGLVGEVAVAQFFNTSGKDISLTTNIYDKDGNLINSVQWPQTDNYYGSFVPETKETTTAAVETTTAAAETTTMADETAASTAD